MASDPQHHDLPTLAGTPPAPVAGDLPTLSPEATTPSADAGCTPRLFGDYEILGELGRGGMGVVYKARQQSLNRIVALKMILSGAHAGASEISRFLSEAQAAAQLQHPHVVQIYEIDRVEGQPFFSLEFVDGGSLADLLKKQSLPSRKAAEIVRTLALAMQKAHDRGLIHRDLKPANVLLTQDGVPKITDFGLAKKIQDIGSQTLPDQIMGTPSYMAPEQADPRLHAVGPHTDIYALGAILYECLTGRPPFVAESQLDIILHVISNPPVPPRLLNPKIDHDLQTICLKCLEKDPHLRYVSARELAEDLTRYLNGDPILARSVNILSRLVRAVESTEHAVEFRPWSHMLFWFAGIIFLGHLATNWILWANLSPAWKWVPRAAQFVLVGVVFWRCRPQTVMPTTSAERQLWAIWIAYFIGYFGNAMIVSYLKKNVVVGGPGAPDHWGELMQYPFTSVLSGVAIFVMGASYWGRYYAIGAGFIVLGVLMTRTWLLPYAPGLFGLAWGAALVAIGLHLRRLGKEAESAHSSRGTTAPTIR